MSEYKNANECVINKKNVCPEIFLSGNTCSLCKIPDDEIIHSKHTPGPWYIIGNNNENHTIMVYQRGKDSYQIAEIPRLLGKDEDDLNARLISAAPELLKALKSLINHQTTQLSSLGFSDDKIRVTPYLKGAFDAIEKAEIGD